MNTTATWQEMVNYGAGDVVYYNGKRYRRIRSCLNVTTETPDISAYWKLLPEEEIISEKLIPPTASNYYESLHEEKDEAVQLLTKVCEYVTDTLATNEDRGAALYYLNEIDGLVEWWLKQKPKSKREQKLEKIASALSLDGKPNDDFHKVAERILQALGE